MAKQGKLPPEDTHTHSGVGRCQKVVVVVGGGGGVTQTRNLCTLVKNQYMAI